MLNGLHVSSGFLNPGAPVVCLDIDNDFCIRARTMS